MVDIRYESDGKGAIASFPIADLVELVSVGILDLDNLPEYGVVLYNHFQIDGETLAKALTGLPDGIKRMIPVDDVTQPLVNIVSDEELNRAGWYRLERAEKNAMWWLTQRLGAPPANVYQACIDKIRQFEQSIMRCNNAGCETTMIMTRNPSLEYHEES